MRATLPSDRYRPGATRGDRLALFGIPSILVRMMDHAVRDVLLAALNTLTHDIEQGDAALRDLQNEWNATRAAQTDLQARAAAIRDALR